MQGKVVIVLLLLQNAVYILQSSPSYLANPSQYHQPILTTRSVAHVYLVNPEDLGLVMYSLTPENIAGRPPATAPEASEAPTPPLRHYLGLHHIPLVHYLRSHHVPLALMEYLGPHHIPLGHYLRPHHVSLSLRDYLGPHHIPLGHYLRSHDVSLALRKYLGPHHIPLGHYLRSHNVPRSLWDYLGTHDIPLGLRDYLGTHLVRRRHSGAHLVRPQHGSTTTHPVRLHIKTTTTH